MEDHSSILYLTYPRGGGEDNSPKCAILLLCAQCPGLWIEAKLKVTLQTMFFTCKWSSSQVLVAWGWLHFLLQDRVSFILASFHILPPTNGLFEALSYTLSKRTDLDPLSPTTTKNPTQSEAITTYSISSCVIHLGISTSLCREDGDARSVSSVSRFEAHCMY